MKLAVFLSSLLLVFGCAHQESTQSPDVSMKTKKQSRMPASSKERAEIALDLYVDIHRIRGRDVEVVRYVDSENPSSRSVPVFHHAGYGANEDAEYHYGIYVLRDASEGHRNELELVMLRARTAYSPTENGTSSTEIRVWPCYQSDSHGQGSLTNVRNLAQIEYAKIPTLFRDCPMIDTPERKNYHSFDPRDYPGQPW